MFQLTELAKAHKGNFVAQHGEVDHFFHGCGSKQEAWETEKGEQWVKDWESNAQEFGSEYDSAEDEFNDYTFEWTPQEVVRHAELGYAWPISFGLVELVEDDEDEA